MDPNQPTTASSMDPSQPTTASSMDPSQPTTASSMDPSRPTTASSMDPSRPTTASSMDPSRPTTASSMDPSRPTTASSMDPSQPTTASSMDPSQPTTGEEQDTPMDLNQTSLHNSPIIEKGFIDEDNGKNKDKSDLKAVDAGSSEMTGSVGEDDITTPENKSSDPSSTVPDPRETGSIDEDCRENKAKSQPKAVDDGGSDIREDDNTSENKSSDTSSTVPAPGETGSVDEDSRTNKDKISPDKQRQKEVDELLCRLNLKDKTLTTADIQNIGPSIGGQHKITESDIAYAFLQKLLMLDHRARYIPVTVDSTEKDAPDSDKVDIEGMFELLCEANVDTDHIMTQPRVHPMDVQMAVFHCSDSFLRQKMITKLSQCQYALPLLVPDPVTRDIECPLWTFRQIKKSWKVTDNSQLRQDITSKSMPICQAETPMVSFFRLGSMSSSKSQLMNTLINDRHNTFFHRNCPGATKSYCLIDGMAEIAWYCPAGKDSDAFSDCVAFCNLRGDALTHETQRNILIDKASVNVVLLPNLERDDKNKKIVSDLLKDHKPLICLLANKDSVAKEIGPGKYIIGVKDRSQSDVAEELKGIIRNILSTSKTSFQLESMVNLSGIKIDEHDLACQQGKSAALQILDLLKEMELAKIKDTFLPCHGQLWHEWCSVKKDLYRLRGNIEKDKCEKQNKLKEIRRKQCEKPSSKLMQMFIGNLQTLKGNEKLYFIKWIVFFLDTVFTDKLSKISQAYDAKWSEVLALKRKKKTEKEMKKHDKSDELERKQNELEEISNELRSATVGFEHILREMGQIYEAHAFIRDRGNWSQYPKLAAELMIAGHPMELMDGDAAHVPLTWITSVLDEVIKTLGDKRVFVLSVLGIQSSGKSTMLNAMFGLQFAVSAGRCTRGAFMQLVKVSDEIQKDLKFDYVLVVDTEGLRAPELAGQDTHHHDNELATFVIGLANMTLINIFGENPSEMQDILHIAVQAFMRMKKVKLSPSCVFVHQNVADIEADEKNKVGKRRLQKDLDEMTKLAAKEEMFAAEFFSDVIAFDVENDVKYFTQLWEGSPPMASPNPGYSENIQELKKYILSKASQSNGMTLSQFKSSIKDLWNALLNENFVFSFKNTQEISLYRKLEEEYGKWTWSLREQMLTTETHLHNRIENGKLERNVYNDLVKEMNKTREEVEQKMKKYFDDDRVKDMLAQWRGRFETKIQELHDELTKGSKQKLEEFIEQRNARKRLDDQKTEYENNLLQKSKELARKLKNKAKDEKKLEDEFNNVWNGWVNTLTDSTHAIKEINIHEDVNSILSELNIPWNLIVSRKTKGNYQKISNIANYSEYVTISKHQSNCQQTQDSEKETKGKSGSWWTTILGFLGQSSSQQEPKDYSHGLPREDVELIQRLIENVKKESIALIKKKPVSTRGYNISYLHEVAAKVKDHLKEFVSQKSFALKKEFLVDLLLHIFDIAEANLLKSHEEFKKKNDARIYLENKKEQYYKVFKSSCEGNSSAAVLSELLCSEMKDSAVQAVHDKTAIHLAREIRHSHLLFSGNRADLERHLLHSLAEQEDFNSYMNYIRHPREQVELFIKKGVEEYISTNKKKVLSIMKKNVDDIARRLSQAVYEATEKVKTQKGDTNMWLKELSSLLKDDIRFATNCYGHFNDINNFDFLREEIEKYLNSMKKYMNSLSINVVDARVTPDQILIDQLCKCCWVQCPFCKAICTNTLEGHIPDKHCVPFHRPSGVDGWHVRGTVELVIDFCTTLVASDRSFYPNAGPEIIPFKEYQNGGPKYADWIITPDESKLIYWKWFVCRFQTEIENHYGRKFEGRGEIPAEWKTHTKQDAIQSLDVYCILDEALPVSLTR